MKRLLLLGLFACGGTTSTSLVWSGEAPPTSAWLTGVWASGDHDVYAVGLGGVIHSNNDGSPWTVVMGIPSSAQLWGIGGSSATDVYAVGEQGAIWHDVSGAWATEPSPVTTGLRHVWANGAQDLYVVGDDGVILHGDGSGTWTSLASGTTEQLWGVWARGPDDVFVVGGNDGLTPATSPASTLVLHSVDGGHTFGPMVLPAGGEPLGAVWGTPGGSIVAVGWSHIYRTTDESTWLEIPNTPGAIGLDALAGDAAHLYAAGNGIVIASDDDGATWTEVLGGFSATSAWVIPRGDCYTVGVGSDGNGGPSVGAIGHGRPP